MKVFLSWSGPRSREAALLFRDWLPKVVQAVDPWMSDVDIEKGAQWFAEISREVSAASFGMVFLTRENIEKPWLHFEAGALAKTLSGEGSTPRVAAYLLGIEPADVSGPLKEFQHTTSTAEDTLKLLGSINSSLATKGEKPLKEEMLKSVFAAFWPSLEEALKAVIAKDESDKPRREVRDMVEEILAYVRPRAPVVSSKTLSLEAEFSKAQENHRALQAQLLELDAAAKRSSAGGAVRAGGGAASRAKVTKEAAARAKDAAALNERLDRARSEFIQNEARLIALREELAVARRIDALL